MTLGVRSAVRSPTGEFLLVRHTYTPGWHFPGGGIEVGQAVEEALAYETGLAPRALPNCMASFSTAGSVRAIMWWFTYVMR